MSMRMNVEVVNISVEVFLSDRDVTYAVIHNTLFNYVSDIFEMHSNSF